MKLGNSGCNLNCPKKPNKDKKKEKKGTWQAQEIIRYKYKKGSKNGGVKVKWIKHWNGGMVNKIWRDNV